MTVKFRAVPKANETLLTELRTIFEAVLETIDRISELIFTSVGSLR